MQQQQTESKAHPFVIKRQQYGIDYVQGKKNGGGSPPPLKALMFTQERSLAFNIV
ncbi:hypothetical protein [Kosakonia oryziphila]|uniref:Uncharacterized protein n=1 Tax=Kosakonia oryziphila TaxID=1005667 RepID=A0A1C3ZXW7_9ENTR|nr:hypothetical protein [Kosakonia oryziphila]SCB87244.1 hypothetical protein GA0061070_100346 [Kosakonia oryziphila]